jgi:hypothetical protein
MNSKKVTLVFFYPFKSPLLAWEPLLVFAWGIGYLQNQPNTLQPAFALN